MRQLTTFRKILAIFAVAVMTVFCAAYTILFLNIPGEMVLIEGEEYFYNLNSIFPVSIKSRQGRDHQN